MPVPLQHMYNANILIQKWVRKWYANFLHFELHSRVGKKISIAQVSLIFLRPFPEKTNPSQPLCPSENLIFQLYLISIAYNLSTE